MLLLFVLLAFPLLSSDAYYLSMIPKAVPVNPKACYFTGSFLIFKLNIQYFTLLTSYLIAYLRRRWNLFLLATRVCSIYEREL